MGEQHLNSVRQTATVAAHGRQLFADDDGDFEQLDHALRRLRTRLDAPGLVTPGGHVPTDEG